MLPAAEVGEIEVLTCKVRIPIGNQTRECGARVGSASLPVVATGRVLPDVRFIDQLCIAGWCHSCKKATEYRYLMMLQPA